MRKRYLRLLTMFLTTCTVLFSVPIATSAQDASGATPPASGSDSTTGGTNPDQSEGTGDSLSNPDISAGLITITDAVCGQNCQGHTITGTTTTNSISIRSGEHKITLKNVNIDLSSQLPDTSAPAFDIRPGATVHLFLEGQNILKSPSTFAGLCVPEGAAIDINDSTNGKLDVTGGGGGAGIGAQAVGPAGTITINSGQITAVGGMRCAGIGGAVGGGAGTININGGTVTATGGEGYDIAQGGSGIGCGSGGKGGDVIVSGGKVTAIGGKNTDSTLADGINCKNLSSGDGNSSSIIASKINSNTITSDFNGIIWDKDKKNGTVYGNALLDESLNGQTLNIDKNRTLTISPKGIWALKGCSIKGSGSIVNYDKLNHDGSLLLSQLLERIVSLTEDDIHTKTQVYTGKDLTNEVLTIDEERYYPPEDTYYKIDDPSSWKRKIVYDDLIDVTEIKNAGSYKITFTKDGYDPIVLDDRNNKTVKVEPKPLTDDMVSSIPNKSYTGNAITPKINITYNGDELDNNDYTAVFSKNTDVGTATVTITAKSNGNYSGKVEKTFTINPASLEKASVTINPVSAPYDGSEKDPKITVTIGSSEDGTLKTLVKGTEYTITPSTNDFISAGTIEYTIEGTGNYTDTAPLTTFTIEALPVTINTNLPPTAKDRDYDGTNEVELTDLQLIGVLPSDKADVKLETKALISGRDVGTYPTVDLIDPKLGGNKGPNYILSSVNGLLLKQPVTISQKPAPDTPIIGGKYVVSSIPERYIFTLEVTNDPKDGTMYEYRMDSKDLPETEGWQDSPVFDNIEPESVHLFEARSKLDPNVKQSEIGEEEFTFDLLEETNKPADIKLTFSPNTDEQTFTGTISSDSKLDNVEYFIGKTGVEPKDEDYQSGDGAQLKTDCESNTEYTAYVRFKKTKTHKPSEPTTTTNSTNRLVAKPPIITPEDGTEFFESQEVTITHKLDGMTIYYTTDGTEPTLESPIYTEPFEITDTTTIKAFAVKNNMDDSEVATATLTLKLRDVKKPVIDPEGESEFTGSRLVEITCETEDATIYYTVDGSDPTTESKKYTEPFRVSTTTVVKAIGVKEGLNNSEIATATLNKSESAINVHAFLNPFITSGDGIENNIISDELMSKLDTTDKAAATESIYQTMTQELSVIGNHGDFTYLKMNFYDLVVKVKIDSDPLRDATLDDFAEGGYTITIPYPDGTSLEANDFAIAHMVASGEKTGNVETWYADKVTKTPYGLQFNITSASPLAIAWTAAVPGGPNSNNVSDGDNVVNPDGENPGGDDPNGDNPDGENPDGENPDGENPAGDDQNNGIVTSNPKTDADGAAAAGNGAGTGSVTDAVKSALSSLLPKTGDTNKIIAWVVVLAASIAVIVGLRIKSKKASGKPKKKH